MAVSKKVIKIEYHREGLFYTYRGKRLKDLKSLKDMRERIMAVKNATWRWHVVLTFNPKSLIYWFKTYGDVGKALSMYFDKVRSKFWGMKYFWKYEEGAKVWCYQCNRKVDFMYDDEREGWVFCVECGIHIKGGDLPHYHILYDYIRRGVRCKSEKMDDVLKKIGLKGVRKTKIKEGTFLLEWDINPLKELDWKKLIFPHNWDKINWKQWFKAQRMYEGRSRTDLEILVGYWHYQKWGLKGSPTGRTYARQIRGYMDLKDYVKKDFFKFTEAKWLKDPSKRKWSHSQNLIKGVKGIAEKEWEQVLETVGMYGCEEALEKVGDTKDNMVLYYDEKGLKGEYIYKRVIDDIKDVMGGVVVVKGIKKEKVQKILDVDMIGTRKCRHCEKMFDINVGFVGMYCSKKCFLKYSRSMKFKTSKDYDLVEGKDGYYEKKYK